MTATIFKYIIDHEQGKAFDVELPQYARPLSVQMQHNKPCMWALIHNHEAPKVIRKFVFYGTGQPMPHKHGEYVGTIQVGPFVWHLFEVGHDR